MPHPQRARQYVPLPARPNLEYERKRAKKLLRQLHEGDTDAVTRATNIAKPPFHLADAQLIVARDYGFASWPRLVQYYEQWISHHRAGRLSLQDRDHFEFRVDTTLEQHTKGSARWAPHFATFIPRFYALPDEDIVGKAVTRAEVQCVVARMNRFACWDDLVAAAPPRENLTEEERVARRTRHESSHRMHLHDALKRSDLAAVQQLIRDHDGLGQIPPLSYGPMLENRDEKHSLLHSALYHEVENRTPEARAITDWVVTLGFELVPTLNLLLTYAFRTDAKKIAHLLERGADPNAVAPSGLSIMDIAVLKYWNGDAVDLIAAGTTPRKAFWMAAGLGDLGAYKSYFGPNDALHEDARADRPDFLAAGLGTPPRPNATDDMIVWDTWLIAGMNQRFNIMDELLSRGWPVNAAPLGGSVLEWAEGNQIEATAAYLRSRGAIG